MTPEVIAQVTSTGITAVATITAIVVAVGNIRQRRADETRRTREADAEALAQARLILTGYGNPGVRVAEDHNLDAPTQVEFPLANYSNQPIRDVYSEAWYDDTPLTDPPSAVHAFIVRQGEEIGLHHRVSVAPSQVRLQAWRVRWTDPHGRQWCRDHYPQAEPEPFTGQPPRPY